MNKPANGPSTAIVGDVGGTNARFALADVSAAKPFISAIREYPSHKYASGEDAVRAYLDDLDVEAPKFAAIAAAGPITDGAVHFTNLGWTLSEAALEDMGFSRARLLNDFEAQALATQHLEDADLHVIGPEKQGLVNATVAVIGPGTGFGASALVRDNDHTAAVSAEGGHAAFAPADETEIEILRILSSKFARASIERILSGPGLQNLHAALNEIEGIAGDMPNPNDITARAMKGEVPFARTLSRFCAILGSVAGDFALFYGARGGVFIAGGIAPSILPFLEKSDFRARFESKGRFNSYVAAIPTRVVLNPHAAFLGAAELAHRMTLSA